MPSTPFDKNIIPANGLMKSLPGIIGIRLDEELKYYVILKEHSMQIRKYRPFILAQTIVRGEFNVARELAMKRLQHYLHGHNDFRERIRRTTPIFQSRGERLSFTSCVNDKPQEESWIMGIILPSRFGIGNMPHPLEKNIKLLKIPSLIVASRRYSGSNSEEVIDKQSDELYRWIEKHPKYKIISEPRYAQYDGPYVVPIFRRNEIQISLIETDVPQKKFH